MLNWIASLLTIKTILVGLLTYLIVKWIIKRLKYKLPPGPTPLPIVGNMLQFKTEFLHKEIFEWTKKFGPVISLYFGPSLVVVVNDIESVMEVTVRKGSDFGGRNSTPSLGILSGGGQDIVFSDYGPLWKIKKKLSRTALKQFLGGNALEQRIHLAIGLLTEEINKAGPQVDPSRYIDLTMGNILIGVCFGGAYDLFDPEVKRLLDIDDEVVRRLFEAASVLQDRIPGLHYVWETSHMRWLKNIIQEIKDIFMPKILEHENTIDRDHVRDFTDALILARADMQEEYRNKITNDHIFHILMNIFYAGIQATRHTLRYAILHMVAYPDIQSKVQDELDAVIGANALPQLKHRPDLGYTEAVFRESMRLSSVIPTGIPHRALTDTTIGDYDVPKDTMVIINHWALHNDPSVWRDVDKFIPERFLGTDGKLGPKPESWLPFSAGKRVCLGETMVKPEFLLLFAALMQRYTWKLPVGKHVDLSPDGNMFSHIPKQHELLVEQRDTGMT